MQVDYHRNDLLRCERFPFNGQFKAVEGAIGADFGPKRSVRARRCASRVVECALKLFDLTRDRINIWQANLPSIIAPPVL